MPVFKGLDRQADIPKLTVEFCIQTCLKILHPYHTKSVSEFSLQGCEIFIFFGECSAVRSVLCTPSVHVHEAKPEVFRKHSPGTDLSMLSFVEHGTT
jgi:hypothetical protein